MKQVTKLAKPVSSRYVKQLPNASNADYVAHSVITELLLLIVGPFDFEITQTIRNGDLIEGCLARLTVDVDGRRTSVVEAGDITGQEKNNGERMKNASSDALKRCAMRLGLGLHLWAQDGYFLYDALTKAEGGGVSSDAPVSAGTEQSSATGPAAPPEPVITDNPVMGGTTDVCPECGRDQLPLAERGGHSPRCSRRPM